MKQAVRLEKCTLSHRIFFFIDLSILADEIMAVLKLDNVTMGQTSWKPCSQQAWDQR